MQLRQTGFLVAALTAAHLAAATVSNFTPAESRPLVALCLITLLSMIAAASSMPRRGKIAALIAATALSMTLIIGWRRLLDPTAVIGPIPGSAEPVALLVFGSISVGMASLVAVAFSAGTAVFRYRWIVFSAAAAVLIAFSVLAYLWSQKAQSPQALLQTVAGLEGQSVRNNFEEQQLSTILSVFGRQHEARVVPRFPAAIGQKLSGMPEKPDSEPPFAVTPWREAMTRIAAEQRLVLIMEDHTISEHRAWIEQTLPLFHAARFTHYFAETIAEPGSQLKSRGYPTWKTGTYTIDPRFGNVVRAAIRLGFEIGGYDDPRSSGFDGREAYQAAALAQQIAARSDCRMVVHAGHAHVLKYEDRATGRYMAARLWKTTGLEPFTIWQISNELPNEVYRDLIRRIGPITEPVMLVPPPSSLTEELFPTSSMQPAVDAIVVHPPRIGQEPTDRRGAFADQLKRVAGEWLGREWPVVIAAIPLGEPDNAIPVDQIMLRPGETEFELWLPHADCEIRVWGLDGPRNVHADLKASPVRVEVRN